MSARKTLLAAATLATGRTIDRWSRVSALASFVALIVLPSPSATTVSALGLSLLAGLAQAYNAARTSLDARVFEQWSQSWLTDSTSEDADLASFDAAMQSLFGKVTADRPLDARIQAAMGLLRRQALAFATQLVLLALAIALYHWGIQA